MENDFGYIYVAEDQPNVCKIGFTRKTPNEKTVQLSCLYHRDFKIKGLFETNDPRKDEKLIHNFLKDYRLRGEWFKLSFEEIKEKVKSVNFYFDDLKHFFLVKNFINNAYWHWDEEDKIWVTRKETHGY